MQGRIDVVARLIHDQAPPIHGLWSVQHQIAQGARGPERRAASEVSRRLLTHLEHLQALATQLRQAVQQRGNEPLVRLRRVDLMPLAVAVIDAACDQARLRGVQLGMSLVAANPTVRGDPTALRRVLENLFTNALDATPRGGQVLLEIWDDAQTPAYLRIAVRDSGPGLSPEQQATIFDGARVSAGPGMGLGLSIVAELTHAMGGEVGVQSMPGVGSTFFVRLCRYH